MQEYIRKFNIHPWWMPRIELTAQQQRFMQYGYDGEGFKTGNYYTKYISSNPKFYQKDGYYGKQIYKPFWNHIR